MENYEFQSYKTLERINSLYKNLNTISLLDLILNYEELNEKGLREKKDFHLFNMRANLEGKVLEWIRARRWRKVRVLLETFIL